MMMQVFSWTDLIHSTNNNDLTPFLTLSFPITYQVIYDPYSPGEVLPKLFHNQKYQVLHFLSFIYIADDGLSNVTKLVILPTNSIISISVKPFEFLCNV